MSKLEKSIIEYNSKNNIIKNLKDENYDMSDPNWNSFESDYAFDYNNINSNHIYFEKYGDDYEIVTNDHIAKVVEKIEYKKYFKDEINILLLGCGHFYEVAAFVEELRKYDFFDKKHINFLCIDLTYWPCSYYKAIREYINKYDNISLWGLNRNFFNELENNVDFYKSFDVIYASRCLNPVEKNKDCTVMNLSQDDYIKKIINIISNYPSSMFFLSQVVSYNKEESIAFEKKISHSLFECFPNVCFYKKIPCESTQKIDIYRYGLNYFLYCIS